jgi:hypothetical protein
MAEIAHLLPNEVTGWNAGCQFRGVVRVNVAQLTVKLRYRVGKVIEERAPRVIVLSRFRRFAAADFQDLYKDACFQRR